MQRRGLYPPPPGASDLPGLEVAGIDRITRRGRDGAGTSAIACARSSQVAATPLSASPRRLSACQCPPQWISWRPPRFPKPSSPSGPMCSIAAACARERSALFHGGSSGIGTTAIQLASLRGARVLATAGSDEKCRACEQLGAERAINYRTEDFVDVVKQLTRRPRRRSDPRHRRRRLHRRATWRRSRVEGRLVVIGFMGGDTATIDFRRVLGRRLTITGSTLRPRSVEEKGEIAAALRREVWPLLESGEGHAADLSDVSARGCGRRRTA